MPLQFTFRHAASAVLAVAALLTGGCCSQCADIESDQPVEVDANRQVLNDAVVEASCGQCQFGLAGEGCDLAIRVDGRSYPVDGSHIDDHGDAHAHDGFCNAVRTARVSGEIDGERFRATFFELLPTPAATETP